MLYFQQKGIRLFKKCFWKVQKQLLLSGVCVQIQSTCVRVCANPGSSHQNAAEPAGPGVGGGWQDMSGP